MFEKNNEQPTLGTITAPMALTTPALRPPRVYLAGPEVFLPKAQQDAVRAAKVSLCAPRGLEGVYPDDPALFPGKSTRRTWG